MTEKKMKAIVVSGFPGVGKTHYFQSTNSGTLDSDSSNFSWIKPGVRNPDFPRNYMNHIKENLDNVDLIFVSSHKDVRTALVEHGIDFIMAYPNIDLKEEYLKRFMDRGDGDGFITFIGENWNSFIEDIKNQKSCKFIELQSGQFLIDGFIKYLE